MDPEIREFIDSFNIKAPVNYSVSDVMGTHEKIIMKKYMTRISQVYVAKNKLERDIQEFLRNNDRLFINCADLQSFKKKVLSHIAFLNLENSRCGAKTASWYDAGIDVKDFGLSGIDCVAFFIHEIKSEYVQN